MNIDDNLPELVQRLRGAGADDAIAKPVLSDWCEYFRPEIQRRARAFVKWAGSPYGPNNKDDLENEGYFAVLEVAKRIRSEEPAEWMTFVGGHANWHIMWRMYELLLTDMVGSSKQLKTLRRQMKEGTEMPTRRSINEQDRYETNPDVELMDAWEEIEASCGDDQELQIIRALADGYTCEECAILVGCHPNTVTHVRSRVWDRYKERQCEN